jgi:hypothetical protein
MLQQYNRWLQFPYNVCFRNTFINLRSTTKYETFGYTVFSTYKDINILGGTITIQFNARADDRRQNLQPAITPIQV